MTKKSAAISARVSEATKQRLNAYAERVGEKATDIIEKAIHRYLDAQEDVATQDEIQDETHTEDNAIQNEIQESKNETQLLEQRLEALEDEIKKLRIDTNGNADAINQLNQNAVTIPDMEGVSCNVPEGEKMQPPTDDNWEPLMSLNEVEEKYGKPEPPLPESLNQTQLAKRLGIGASTLHKARNRADFSEWSKGKDPNGVAWKYGTDKKYHPLQA